MLKKLLDHMGPLSPRLCLTALQGVCSSLGHQTCICVHKVRHTVQGTGALMVTNRRHIPSCSGATRALPPAVSAQLDGQAGRTTQHGRPTDHGQQVAAP